MKTLASLAACAAIAAAQIGDIPAQRYKPVVISHFIGTDLVDVRVDKFGKVTDKSTAPASVVIEYLMRTISRMGEAK